MAVDAFVEGDAFEYAACATENTTGQSTWDAARRLETFLRRDDRWGRRDSDVTRGRDDAAARRRTRALELGSGNGWLGMALVRERERSGVGEMVMTERARGGALEWLRRRVEANAAWTRDGSGAIACKALDWVEFARDEADGGDDDGEFAGFDAIFGSDLVYDRDGVEALPRVVAALLRRNPGAEFWYAHTKHRYDGMDEDFFAEIERCGLSREEVREDGVPTPPPSPPPFESLFPDQRIAVYRISLDASANQN